MLTLGGIAPERRGLGKNPLGNFHISIAPTNAENFSGIGDIACAAICRFLQAGAIKLVPICYENEKNGLTMLIIVAFNVTYNPGALWRFFCRL